MGRQPIEKGLPKEAWPQVRWRPLLTTALRTSPSPSDLVRPTCGQLLAQVPAVLQRSPPGHMHALGGYLRHLMVETLLFVCFVVPDHNAEAGVNFGSGTLMGHRNGVIGSVGGGSKNSKKRFA